MRTLLFFLVLSFPVFAYGQVSVDIDTTFADKDCGDYESRMQAQADFVQIRDLTGQQDPYGLDGNGDGIACNSEETIRVKETSDSTRLETGEMPVTAECPGHTVQIGQFQASAMQVLLSGDLPASFIQDVRCVASQVGVDLYREPPGHPPEITYADECRTSVENATVHVPETANRTMLNGQTLTEGDTVAAMAYESGTGEEICAGYAVWDGSEGGATLAAAGTNEFVDGYVEGENLRLDAYDVSADRVFRLDPTWNESDTSNVGEIWAEGVYENGSFNQVAEIY